jgi:hypothetical protein
LVTFQNAQDKTIAYVGDSLGRHMFQFMMCMANSGKEQEDVEDVGVVYGFIVSPCAKRPDGWAYEPFYTIGHRHCDLEPMNQSNQATSYAMYLDRPPAFVTD